MKTQRTMLAILLALAFVATLAPAYSQSAPATSPQASKPTAAPSPTAAPPATKPTTKAPVPASWKQVPIPPLPPFKPQVPIRFELPNGMVVFLQVDHELPLVGGTARIRGGSDIEPAAKVGLVDVYGDVWRTGGTTSKTGDQLDDFLEARAAKVETSSGSESTSIGFSCLKQDFEDVFKVWLEVMRDPAFRQDKIDLAKKQMDTSIARRNDSSDEIADRESVKLAYGKENPYAREPEYSTVAAITREDLVNWHKQYLHPNNIIVGISGDFDPKQMETRLREAFANWEKGPEAPKPEIKFTPAKPALYLVNKEDVNQSEIRMVSLGIEKSNPDYFPVVALNEVFSGGFSSRLFTDLRTKRGLAYSVGGGIGSGWDHPGITALSIGTKSSTTTEAIKGLWEEMDGIVKNPPTETELKRAKDSILNSFIFNFDTPAKVMRERMLYQFYGYPQDFLEQYRAGVEKVTTADVARVAKKYMHRDQLAVLVVGNEPEFDKQFSSLGPVVNVDITIPEPGAAPGSGASPGASPAREAAPKASNAEGKALINEVVQFLGGEQKVASVKALEQQGKSTRITPQGEMPLEMDSTLVLPDRAHIVFHAQGQEIHTVLTPAAAFQYAPGAGPVQDLPPSLRQDSINGLKRDPVNIAQHANDSKYIFAAEGTEKVGDVTAAVLEINADGSQVRWLVDPKSGQILRSISTVVSRSGPAERVVDYSDWKLFDGLKLPTKRTTTENGKPFSVDTVENWIINPPVDPKSFEKPTSTS